MMMKMNKHEDQTIMTRIQTDAHTLILTQANYFIHQYIILKSTEAKKNVNDF